MFATPRVSHVARLRRARQPQPVDLERARYLVSPAGREALEQATAAGYDLEPNRLAAALRKLHPPAESAAIAEQLALNARARTRFGADYRRMLLSAAGLEMMTHPLVARRRAARLAGTGRRVADLTCGIGSDLSEVAAVSAGAVGIEADAATALIAAANVPAASVIRGDATRLPLHLESHSVLIDPARRGPGGRRFDPAAFSPTWDQCLELLRTAASGVLKAPPGLGHQHVPDWAELEAVQLGRDLRELALWAGSLAEPGLRRAVLLPEGIELDSRAPQSEGLATVIGRYLLDPESCVTRAGLVRHLAAATSSNLLDDQVAYLTTDAAVFHPMAATFEVLDVLPFSIQRLKSHLRTNRLRPDEIRRRAFPVEPDELRRLLGNLQGERVALLCTTIHDQRLVAIARRVYPPTPGGA